MPIKLKKWLTGIWIGISKIFHKAENEIKHLLPIVISVVENVKKVVDSPVADVATHLIDGNFDDIAKEKLREWLPKIILELHLIDTTIHLENINEQLAVVLAKLKLSSDAAKNVFYHGLASLILEKISDGKLSWSDAVIISEYYYQHELDKAA